ncbi:MAG: hypothetical protein E7L17_00960 [Clostridium sp.]|uniref:hypothetical protein n=1 Tax=Clostridium sp. TaxID=1506 RepID=UPI0029108AE4|nr:hypothetical protein [Clostridium sp.]MDU7336665.1 hypothetical protein [Clostridium sp.]
MQNLTHNLQRTGLSLCGNIDTERELSRIPKAEPLVVERESKGRESILSLWKAFATFRPFAKGCARPGTRGKALRQQSALRHSAKLLDKEKIA